MTQATETGPRLPPGARERFYRRLEAQRRYGLYFGEDVERQYARFRAETACDRVLLKYDFGTGGLLRRAEAACHMTEVRKQIVVVLCVTWLPLTVIGLISEYVYGRPEPFLRDVAVQARLLFATPLLLVMDKYFPLTCRRTLYKLSNESFIPRSSIAHFERILARSVRATDSIWPEVVIILIAVGLGIAALGGYVSLRGIIPSAELTLAQKWYILTDLPIFQFLLWRSLWRWLMWSRLLIGIGLMRLRPVPTHPDGRGGLAFLRYPSVGYCAGLLFLISTVVCAEWGGRFTVGDTFGSFKPILLLFVAGGTVIAFGPLLFFSPHLFRAHREGVHEVGALATRSGRRFNRRWNKTRQPSEQRDRELEGLAATIVTYRDSVDRIRYVLFDLHDVLLLTAATLLPVIPVMLIHLPAEEWLLLLNLIAGRIP